MADAGQGPESDDEPDKEKRKKPKKKRKKKRKPPAKRRNLLGGRRIANLIWSIAHPVRRRILRAIAEQDEACSPTRIAEQLDLPVSMVTYHASVLRKFEAVEVAGEQEARDAAKRLYDSAIGDHEAIEALLEETREVDDETT